jgi:predicted GNAT superfamily acetyltransferase
LDLSQIEPIFRQDEAVQAALLDLNNANARETSLLTSLSWHSLIREAFSATCVPGPGALLLAFDQDADYHSPNFKWFHGRFSRFVYVDRIIVAQTHRGQGLAGDLYWDLFERARAADHDRIVCEVNLVPPNPGSDAFHARMGFTEVGRATLDNAGKTVRYLEKHL